MKFRTQFAAATAVTLLLVSACGKPADKAATPTETAAKAAGGDTIASGLGDATKFSAAAKAVGLDATLGGPGPYTVLVPTDAAFGKLPAGAVDTLMKPDSRARLTGILSYHILPGTMLAADIAKAIDGGGGKAEIATMGGGNLTATKDGDKIVFTDAAGTKATVTAADEKRSNGVVHMVDSVLMPARK
ncbi:MAG: fasciclin domain-containing protein [Sphingomicrobium sp.]